MGTLALEEANPSSNRHPVWSSVSDQGCWLQRFDSAKSAQAYGGNGMNDDELKDLALKLLELRISPQYKGWFTASDRDYFLEAAASIVSALHFPTRAAWAALGCGSDPRGQADRTGIDLRALKHSEWLRDKEFWMRIHELYVSRENRDIRYKQLKAQRVTVTRSTSRGQLIHPMYIEDWPIVLSEADKGFGNTIYKTYVPVLYKLESSEW
jgi:hypothetical protein